MEKIDADIFLDIKNLTIDIIKKLFITRKDVNITDEEIFLFLQICKTKKLNPILKQIYLIPYKGRYTACISIDGYRSIGVATGEYEGQTTPLFCGPDGVWKEIWSESRPPFAAKVGIYRKGFREPLYKIAEWGMYGKAEGLWKSGGRAHMLAKCAECLCWRAAFPEELAGTFSREELDASDEPSGTHNTSNGAQTAEADSDSFSASDIEADIKKKTQIRDAVNAFLKARSDYQIASLDKDKKIQLRDFICEEVEKTQDNRNLSVKIQEALYIAKKEFGLAL